MPDDQPYLLHPGVGEQAIAAEMIRDKYSKHWEACRNFVNKHVHTKAKNIPIDLRDDVVQEVMYKVRRGLPGFRFESTLKGWVNIIIERCIIDTRRRLQHEEITHVALIEQPNEGDHEGERFTTSEVKSAEDSFLTNEEIRSGWAACLEYVSTHAHFERNRLILRIVILEGKTYAEAARATGCSEPVVGYVVREAQLYARKMRERR